MSAAQALSSGMPPPASPTRSTTGGASPERGDASFRDTLDTASRSPADTRLQRSTPEGARGRKGSSGEASGDANDESGARSGEAAPLREAAGVAELSLVLARLGGTAPSEDGAGDVASAIHSVTADAAAGRKADEAGPWRPGQTKGDEVELDGERMRALLDSGLTESTPLGEQETMTIKAKVSRQETHLALGLRSPDALANAAAEDAVAAERQALPSQGIEDAARSARASGEGFAAGSRAEAIAERWGASDMADQGAAGQDGRNPEGRGSGGAGAQQQGPGAFAATQAGAILRGADAAGGDADAELGYDPVQEQIAARVRDALGTDADGASPDGVVKVLNLELKPANLGSVTVRLALKDNAITIHIEAQRPETLAAIEREREALVGALASAGYAVDAVTAAPLSETSRSAVGFGSHGDSANPSGGQGGPPGQSGQGHGLGGSSSGQGRSGGSGSGNAAHSRVPDGKEADSPGIRTQGGGIYV